MQHFAYRVYKNGQLNQPVFGGTVSARSMDEAVSKVVISCQIEVIHEVKHGTEYHDFQYNGQKVGILIYANPENY